MIETALIFVCCAASSLLGAWLYWRGTRQGNPLPSLPKVGRKGVTADGDDELEPEPFKYPMPKP